MEVIAFSHLLTHNTKLISLLLYMFKHVVMNAIDRKLSVYR